MTVLVGENLLRLPLSRGNGARRSLSDAQRLAPMCAVASAPIQAVMMARAEPEREMVYFVAGFETLLAPLAGMVLEGLLDNLSILLVRPAGGTAGRAGTQRRDWRYRCAAVAGQPLCGDRVPGRERSALIFGAPLWSRVTRTEYPVGDSRFCSSTATARRGSITFTAVWSGRMVMPWPATSRPCSNWLPATGVVWGRCRARHFVHATHLRRVQCRPAFSRLSRRTGIGGRWMPDGCEWRRWRFGRKLPLACPLFLACAARRSSRTAPYGIG